VEILNDNPNITIELRSHTDSRASDQYNMELSQKRAQAVVDYLISKGIDPQRLIAKGYGESEPKVVDKKLAAQYPFLKEGAVLDDKFINSLPTEEEKEICHQINRRTEFQVISHQRQEIRLWHPVSHDMPAGGSPRKRRMCMLPSAMWTKVFSRRLSARSSPTCLPVILPGAV